MFRNICLLILLAVSTFVTAQTDHAVIRQRIMEGPFTTDDLIFKGRQLLVDRFEAMQFDSVQMIIDFFDAEIDARAFLPAERILFATHYPMICLESNIVALENSTIDCDAKNAILHNNAEKLFGFKQKGYLCHLA